MARPSPTYSGDPALVSIGQAIRQFRLEAGLSQERLANEVGIDRSYMGGIERGEHNLSMIKLARISRCLGISASELLGRAGV